MLSLIVILESFAYNTIASSLDGVKFISSIYFAVEASAVVNLLDFELMSSLYALSEGASFSGNRLAGT